MRVAITPDWKRLSMSKAFIASGNVGMSPVATSGVLISGGGSIVNESLCARLLVNSIRF